MVLQGKEDKVKLTLTESTNSDITQNYKEFCL